MGASAGGVQALSTLVAGLPPELPAALLVVLHVSAAGESALPRILERAGALPCSHPSDGEPMLHGRIYVAPPDRHMVVSDGVLRLTRGPRENGHRPAVDPLFRSAARHCDGRVCGVVLSGALDDGTAGLAAVAAQGGVTVVQDPRDALYRGMPSSALGTLAADHVAPASEIPRIIASLAGAPIPPRQEPPPPLLLHETDLAELDMNAIADLDPPGTPSPFSCPDCGGNLWEIHDGHVVRYRCRVGHAFAPGSLAAQQDIMLESALWAALRALEERADLSRRLAAAARERGHTSTARQFEEHQRELVERAGSVRAALSVGGKAVAGGGAS